MPSFTGLSARSLHRSLRGKIFAAILFATLLPLLGAGWLMVSATYARLRGAVIEDAQREGQFAQAMINGKGQELLAAAQMAASEPGFSEAVRTRDRAALVTLTDAWVRTMGVSSALITDSQGVALVGEQPSAVSGDNVRQSLAGLPAALEGRPLYGYEMTPVDGPAIVAYAPVNIDGHLVGVVSLAQKLDSNFLASIAKTVGLDLFAVSADGNTSGRKIDASMLDALRRAPAAYSGVGQVGGHDTAFYGWHLQDLSGRQVATLGILFPLDVLYDTESGLGRTGLIAGLTALVVSVLLAWLLSRLLIVPLERIAQAARQVADGEEANIPRMGGGGELQILSESLRTMVATLSDLAHTRAALVEELQLQNRQLEQITKHKSEFLANMSHELRAPLNGIIGFAELMHEGKAGPVPERHREYLGYMLTSAEHLLNMINDVLDLSKVEAGRMEFHPEPVDLRTLIGDVVNGLSSLAEGKQLTVTIDVDPSLAWVMADSGKLKQVLYNYLSNALKFTPTGGHVTLRALTEEADAYRLEVEDTGLGISVDDLNRLFREFEQLDTSVHKRYAGTGLGLALTKRIVEAQGGRVGVRSAPHAGSTFFAILPLELPVKEPAKEPDRPDAVSVVQQEVPRPPVELLPTKRKRPASRTATGASASPIALRPVADNRSRRPRAIGQTKAQTRQPKADSSISVARKPSPTQPTDWRAQAS